MSFSIEDFWNAIARATAEHIDFRKECAREVAHLNIDPHSRIHESSFFTSLQSAGVPGKIVTDLRHAWEPQFNAFRDLSRMTDLRTPPLKLFKICAESVASKFDRPLNKALAQPWLGFAVQPTEREKLNDLLSRMERYGIDPQWTARLLETWEFLFGPGGHSDTNQKAPNIYYELYDERAAHYSIVHPIGEGTLGATEESEDEIELALDLLNDNQALIISGRDLSLDRSAEAALWIDSLKRELADDGVHVVDMMDELKGVGRLRRIFDNHKAGSIMMTDRTLGSADGKLRKFLAEIYFELNSPKNNPFRNPIRTLVVFADRGDRSHDRAAKEIAPMLGGLGLGREVPVLAMKNGLHRSKAVSMPGGNWKEYMGRFRSLASGNFVTIHCSAAPFRTFMLPAP